MIYLNIRAAAVNSPVSAEISIPALAASIPSFFGLSGTKMFEPGSILG
jgi:hypothetical protein